MLSLVFPEQSLTMNKYTIPPYLVTANNYLHYVKTGTLDDQKVGGKLIFTCAVVNSCLYLWLRCEVGVFSLFGA